MSSFLAARRSRPKAPDVWPAKAIDPHTSVWATLAPALGILLSLSCGRSLVHDGSSSRGSSAGGAPASSSGGQGGDSGETPLGQTDTCGGCGDPMCMLAHTLFTCADGGKCEAAVCAPGFANCNISTADCETSFESPPGAGGCLPHYVDTLPIATGSFDNAWTAIAPDGSFFLAGTFSGAVDFDPSPGRAVRVPSSAGNNFLIGGTSNGGTVDFDPGPGIDPIFGEISFLSRFTL